MRGTAYVWGDGDRPEAIECADPETEIDGDLLWLWVGEGGARLNFEAWEGQAQHCLAALLEERPELADLEIADASPAFDPGTKLREIADRKPFAMRSAAAVETLYHGTAGACLDAIRAEGVRGDLEWDRRSWKVADVPVGTVYLTAEPWMALDYARRAAARFGGEPVVVEIAADRLDAALLAEDWDFPAMEGSEAWRAGRYGDCPAADASLTLIGKIGYGGTVPPEAIVAVLRPAAGGWEREELEARPRRRGPDPQEAVSAKPDGEAAGFGKPKKRPTGPRSSDPGSRSSGTLTRAGRIP